MIMKATEHDMYRLLDYKGREAVLEFPDFWDFSCFLTIAFGRVSVYS